MARTRTETDPDVLAKALQLLADGDPDGAVKLSGLALRTLYRRRDDAAGKPVAPAPPPTSEVVHVPQGGAVSTRPDLLELVRRILDARNPAARAELEEALRVHVSGGEPALVAWLARPIAAVEIGRDELDTLREGLGFVLGIARTAEPGGPQLRALGILDRLAKSVSVVQSRRPRAETPDEVTQRIVEVRDAAVDRIGVLTSDAAAKLEQDRTALNAWAAQELAPRVAGELRTRIDAMLGSAP